MGSTDTEQNGEGSFVEKVWGNKQPLMTHQEVIARMNEIKHKKAAAEEFVQAKIAEYYTQELGKPNMGRTIGRLVPNVMQLLEDLALDIKLDNNDENVTSKLERVNIGDPASVAQVTAKQWKEIISKAIAQRAEFASPKIKLGEKHSARQGAYSTR